jgi:hypothetical protein
MALLGVGVGVGVGLVASASADHARIRLLEWLGLKTTSSPVAVSRQINSQLCPGRPGSIVVQAHLLGAESFRAGAGAVAVPVPGRRGVGDAGHRNTGAVEAEPAVARDRKHIARLRLIQHSA